MQRYILRRLLYGIPTVIGVSIVIFLAMRVVPGDPVVVMFGDEPELIRPEDRAKIEADLGLSDPLVVQYGNWLKDIATGKLGVSFWRGDTVADLIKRRGPITVEIAVIGIVLAWAIGVPIGILSAMHQNSVADYLARSFTILFLAIPSFWLASLTVLLFLLVWGWAAPLGVIDIWDNPIENLQIVLRPGIVLGLAASAYIARMTRSTLLEVVREDYIRTARAKGLRERVVVWRHALRNSMLPVVTLSGIIFGFMLEGSIVLEQAFNVPGLGKAMVGAFRDVDYTVIQSLVLLYGVVFVLINLLIDVSYGWLDPRIRYA